MKRLTNIKNIIIICLLLLLVFFGSGCDIFSEEEIYMLADAYLEAHDMNTNTARGVANIGKQVVTGSTGDKEADAAIGVRKLVEKIEKADNKMEEGRKYRSSIAMEEAIDMFPKCWTYRVSRYALAVEKNDYYQAQIQGNLADQFSKEVNKYQYQKQIDQKIDELEKVHDDLVDNKYRKEGKDYVPGTHGELLYSELKKAYEERYKIFKRESDLREIQRCERMMKKG